MAEGQTAVKQAERALTAARERKDQRALADALDECVKVYIALPDTYEALRAAKEALKVKKELGDTKGEAEAMLLIGEMHFSMNSLEEALKYEERAQQMFSTLGDRLGAAAVDEALTKVQMARGEPGLAPHRSKGLAALEELKRAIKDRMKMLLIGTLRLRSRSSCSCWHFTPCRYHKEELRKRAMSCEAHFDARIANLPNEAKDATRFHVIMGRLENNPAVSKDDVADTLAQSLKEDYASTAQFYKETLDMQGLLQPSKATEIPKQFMYFCFRSFGGLTYGPAFRYCNNLLVDQSKDMEGFSVMQMSDDREGWEYDTAYSHGILDGVLHTGFSVGLLPRGSDGTIDVGRA